MKLTRAIAGTVVAAALSIGVAAPSFAASTPPAKPSAECVAAFRTLVDEVRFDQGLHRFGHDLGVIRAWAVKTDHPKVVTAVDARLAQVTKAEDALAVKIKAQYAAVKAACTPPAPAS